MSTTIKQQLNNYTNKYQSYKGWLKKETEHYVFHYVHGSQAEKDIEKITQRQEQAFKKIVGVLGLETPRSKIKYYFYPSEKKKTELMGDDGNAQAIWHDFSIHAVYTDEIKPIGEHEDTHLLVLPWGISIGFLQEKGLQNTWAAVSGMAEMQTSLPKKRLRTTKYQALKIF